MFSNTSIIEEFKLIKLAPVSQNVVGGPPVSRTHEEFVKSASCGPHPDLLNQTLCGWALDSLLGINSQVTFRPNRELKEYCIEF